MTQDGPEAQTRTDFEEDCDAVNQTRASKINDSGKSAYQRVFGGNPPKMEDAILECGGADLGVVSWQQAGELTQERSMTTRRLAAKKPTNAFWHAGVVISNTLATVWIAYRGSAVKCARSHVRPFHEDEAADEHVTEHMRKLGERQLHEGDFSYEDITGQDEPPEDSPPAPRENTATGPSGKGQMDVDPEARRRMRGNTRTVRTGQQTAPPSNATTDMARQETV